MKNDDYDDRLPWDTVEDEPVAEAHLSHEPVLDLTHNSELELAQIQVNDTSKDMWLAMETYHNMGLSMMWGRAQDEPERKKKAKSPIVDSWSSDIERRFTLQALAGMMNKANPNIRIAPIIICGKGSGNLIAIDIDLKYWPGIDVKFFLALQQTLPHIWPMLRIHKTPSGGYHLLYRTEVHVDFESKNPKLAYREGEKEAAIESRTHGGYIMSPPGMGYSVFQDVPIPTISVEDHERIFAIARLFNEKVTIKAPPKTKVYDSIYDENPFEHYNSSDKAEYILRDNGWSFDYENSQFTHWTRPGKDGGVSASWHKDKRFFHFFTTSTEIDTSKWNGNYGPANVRCMLECHGDWKKLYRILKDEGFGKHKPDYEAKVIRKFKETGKDLPANFSEEAKAQLQVAIVEKNEKYPHGIFWEYNPKNESYIIQRKMLEDFMDHIGLRLYKSEPCIIGGQFIRKLKEDKRQNGARDVFKILKEWIREDDEEINKRIYHEFSRFWQGAGEFMVGCLPPLDESIILKSNSKVSYKFFLNGILKITKDNLIIIDYDTLSEKKIWADRVIQREFNYVDEKQQKKSMYVDFLGKALKSDPEYVKTCIGFLTCGYKTSEESYFILLQEPRATIKGGGSGKGYFFKGLEPWIKISEIDAEALKKDVDQLLQSCNGDEDAVHLSDLPKWVNLSSLKNIISGDSQKKMLYKDVMTVRAEDMPKIVGSTQFGLDIKSDGGVHGRARELAFTDYFGRNYKRISDEYGGHCPEIWDTEERIEKMGWDREADWSGKGYDWDGYFSYLADAVKLYLGKLKIDLVVDNGLWEKGFDMRYCAGNECLRKAIKGTIGNWASVGDVGIKQLLKWYTEIDIPSEDRIGAVRLHMALKEYGEQLGLYSYLHMGEKKLTFDGAQDRYVKIKLLKQDVG